MLRAVLIGLGGLFTLAMIGASMTMNFLFGFGFGHTLVTAWVWGGLSVASDGLKAVLPVLIAYQWRRRNWMRVVTGLLLLPLVFSYGFLSALGFWAESRGLIVDGRSNDKAGLAQAQFDLVLAEKRLASLAPHRLTGIVEAELAGMQRERQWEFTKGCREAENAAGRTFCKRLDALRAELALNEESQTLTRTIQSLKSDIKVARARGAWRQADPLADAMAWVLRLDVTDIRTGLSWMAAILVETVSCFGLLVVEEAGLLAGLAKAGRPVERTAERAAWRLVGKAAETEVLQAQARG